MNKREFVLSGCASVLGTRAWAATASAVAGTTAAAVPTRRAQWHGMLGHEFVLQTAPCDVVRLVEVRHLGQSPDHEQFALIFVAAAATRERAAGSTLLRHAEGRQFPLYLEPMDRDPTSGRARSAAHFSLLT